MLEFLEFKETCILTGIEQRKSKQTGKSYIIANFLGENGKTFGCIVDCEIPQGLKQLDKVEVRFKVVTGRYTHLRVTNIKKIE